MYFYAIEFDINLAELNHDNYNTYFNCGI